MLTKLYERAHSIEYEGASEGDELWLWGLWRMPGDRGGFHILPRGANDPTRSELKATRNAPHRATRRVVLEPVIVP